MKSSKAKHPPKASSKKTTHKKSSSSQSVSTYKNLQRHRSLSKKERKSRKKAEYLASLPKSRFKRFIHQLHPKRFFKYWFSKEGLIMAAKLGAAGFAVMALVVIGTVMYFRRDLPNPRDVSNRALNQTTKFYDKTGEVLLFELYGDVNRTLVEFDQINNNMKWATVAVEDKDFYEHGGVSFRGIIRAAVNNVFGDGGKQGGSTITQQFIKNSLLTDEQTVTRKIKEVILAGELERLYSKEEILSFYLNEIPFGSLEYGIEAAAQSFFGKPASDLTVAESALLAALPQAPSYFSPYGDHTEELIARQRTIINLMAEQGYITHDLASSEKEIDILGALVPSESRSIYNNIKAPHFVLEVQKQLEDEYGANFVRNSGLKIITTLDYDLQQIAERAVVDNMITVVNPPGGGGGDNAALVSTDVSTGHVNAMVGSRDFKYPEYGSFNAALASRQPGSSIKPFGYAELFNPGSGINDNRWGPDSYIYDTVTTFGADYTVTNYDRTYKGRMKVRDAIGQSRNVPAVKALYLAGLDSTIKLAQDMGNLSSFNDAERYGLSFILGAAEVKLAEHAHAYASFAREGAVKDQTYILKVENADGEVLQEWEDSDGEEVLSPEVAYLITDILSDDSARAGVFGRNNPLFNIPGVTHAAKTGTTNDDRDGWMMGYTKYISAGVWVGNHDNEPMGSFTSRQTGPIFTQFLKEAHEAKGWANAPIIENRPSGIKEIWMDSDTGYVGDADSVNTHLGLFPSWYVSETAEESGTYQIDSISEKKPTSCTPERAIEDRVGSGSWPEIVPSDVSFGVWAASAGYGTTSSGPTEEDDVHQCSDTLPSVSLSTSKVDNGIYEFKATITKGTHALETLNFKVNGQIVNVIDANSNGTYEYTHAFSSTGSKNVTAEVVDSVLYENSQSKTITISQIHSGNDLKLTKPAAGSKVDANKVDFKWSTIGVADGYQVCWEEAPTSSPTCIKTASTSYSPASGIDDNTDYIAYVQAYLGTALLETSPAVQFETN